MATTRREFLRAGALGALGWGVVGSLERAAATSRRTTSAPDTGTVLVTVNLFGGNDGLNTVVPLRQYQRYKQLRARIGISRQRLLPLEGYEQDFAFNPGMRALAALFRQGKVAVINAVGCPREAQGLFDHEASQQNFLTGTTDGTAPPAAPSGWLGRYLDRVTPGALPAGIDFSGAPLLLSGESYSPLSLYSINGFGVFPSADFAARYEAYTRLQQGPPAPPGVGERTRQLRQQVVALGGELQRISDDYQVSDGVLYPPTYLGAALRDCAALIAADRGVRALAVGAGGFDTHADQQALSEGTPVHESLWITVAEAVRAFYTDIKGHGFGDKVVVLIFTEFGRRPQENNDRGTDHGFAGPVFAVGDPVKGGVYGDYSDLREQYLVLDENLDVKIDFRTVYATLLSRHLGVDPGPLLGGDFGSLGFLG